MSGARFDLIEEQLSQIEEQLSQLMEGMAALQTRLDRFEITMLETIRTEFNSFGIRSNRISSRTRKG